jgi:RHS repeat-associated protein
MNARHTTPRRLRIAVLATLLAATSFVVDAAPGPYVDSAYGPPAPFGLGPDVARAYCATKPEFTGRLTASSSSTTAVGAITSPTVYGYLSSINTTWSCMSTYRYSAVTWNTGTSAGTYVWGALVLDTGHCVWVVGTDDYLKANSTTDCPDFDAEYAMSVDLNPEHVYQNDNTHDTIGDFGFAHDDCTSWYGSKKTLTGASFSTSATNNRPGANCGALDLDGTGTTQTVTYDATAPTGTISVNSGAAATGSTTVTLTLSATDGISGVYQRQFSNDNSTWSAWEAYGTSKTWTLTGGDGTKTVYVKYRDNNLNSSAAFSDTITLDTALPTVDFTTPNEATTAVQNSTSYSVAWTEAGTGSSIASRSLQRQRGTIVTAGSCSGVTFTNDGTAYTGTNNPKSESSLANGYCYRWQQTVADQGGNTSAVQTSGSVLVDTATPTVDFSAPNESTTTVQGTTTYSVAWTENGTGTTIAARSLQRQRSAVVTPGVCPTTAWASDGTAYTGASPKSETGLLDNYAYRWVQSPTDGAGNAGSGTSGCLIVETSLPAATFSVPANGLSFRNTTSIGVTWTEDGGGSTITARSLQMQSGSVVTAGTCDGVSWTNDGSPSTATTPVNFTLVSGKCYRWLQTLTNQLGLQGVSTSGSVLVDTVAPTASISAPQGVLTLAGDIGVTGTASDGLSYAEYELEYGAGAAPSSWTSLVDNGASVTAGTLHTWLTGSLQGVYSLRLTVRDLAGNVSSPTPIVLYLGNSRRGEEGFYTRVPFDLGGGWRMAVGVANGELTLDRALFEIPSYGPAQSLALSYSSAEDGSAGMLGAGWNSNLTQYLSFESGFVVWHRADGGLVPFGLVNSVWTPLAGHFETMTYDGVAHRYTITSKDQSKLVFEDAGSGHLVQMKDRFGKALTLAWTATTGTFTDASGRHSDAVISSGQITSVTDSAGRQWQFAYTGSNLTTVTDPASKATTLAYSGSDLTSITRTRTPASGPPAETITWSVGYTSGKVTSVTDPVNASASNTFTYNAGSTGVGLLKTYTPTYNSWTYAFDSFGRVTRATDPLGFNTDYAFDVSSNLTSMVLPIDGTTTQAITYTYDSRGNPLTQTTQLSATESVITLLTYNASNDLLIRSEANNDSALKLITHHVYDGSGHLISLNVNCTTSGTTPPTDASTCTGAGTQNSSTNLITTFTYTPNDQLETETDPLGRVTKHVYDTYGNETSAIANFVSGGGSTESQNVTASFAFDQATTAGKAGLPTSMTDPVGNVTTYLYDLIGRQTSEALPGDSAIPALTRTTSYDELANVLTETEAWPGATRPTTHVYDKANRETSVTDPASVQGTTSYDAAGNATGTTAGGVTTTRAYDGLGRVTTETVGSDSTTHAYDAQGRETQTIDPAGVTTNREYDLGGRLTREATVVVPSPLQELVTTYVYELLGRQTSTTSPEGVITTTAYDRPGRTTSTIEAGQVTTHAYDRAGNETSTTAPDNTVTTTTFDPLNRPTVVVANDVATPTLPTEDVTTTTWYDAAGRTLATRDDAGIGSRSINNVRGLAATAIANCTDSGTTPSPNPPACVGAGIHNATTNVVTTESYDGAGAATTVVVAQGTGDEATLETAYDAAGRQQATRDPRGTVTRTLYDSAARVSSTVVNCTESTSNPVPPTGNWWECDGSTLHDGTWNVTSNRTYDSHGNTATETAPNGRVTTYVYDQADRLIQRIDNDVTGNPSGNEDLSTYFAYDAAGRQSAVRAPATNRTTFVVVRYFFNDQGQLVKQLRNCTDSGTTPPGDPAWKTCAGNGTQDSATNLITTYEYDEMGNRVAVVAPDPAATSGTSIATVTTRYAFDPETNRLCGVLENATITLATPDPCATDPGANGTPTQNVWTEYAYDGLSNIASMTDGRGKATTYAYDGAGHMTKLTDALGNTTIWTFDELGRRTAQSERGTGSQPTLVNWTYDGTGRIATRTADSVTTAYSYDDNGNRLMAQSGSGPIITTTYDRLNRPLSVTVSNDSAATTTYTYSLTAPSWTDPSGSYTSTLDKFDRQVDLADPVNGTTHWIYGYRADGQPSVFEAPNDNDTTFTYDAAGKVVNKKTAKNNTRRVEYAWAYNRAGNILSEDYTKITDAVIPAGFAYDGIGRLAASTRDGATTLYGWQAVPNRDSTQYASDPAVTTTYNDANRPLSDSAGGTYSSNDEGQLELRPGQDLDWDGLGRLKEVWNAAHTTRLAAYTYDALDRLLIVDRGATDQLRFRYVGVTTAVAQIVDHDASTVIRSIANDWAGERLVDWTGTNSNQRYYGTNGHHDVSWTATSTGTVDATLRYDPWGNLTSSSGPSLPDFRFQGSWLDTGSQLSWAVARWYAPSLGRFVSEDSLLGDPTIPASRHLYAYGGGEPVSRSDPSGHAWLVVQPGQSLDVLAYRYRGDSRKWPIIFNQNRWVYGTDTAKIPVATCVWVSQIIVDKYPVCPSNALKLPITGAIKDWNGIKISRDWMLSTLGWDKGWLMLTAKNVEDLTNSNVKRTEDVNDYATIARYLWNTSIPDLLAQQIVNPTIPQWFLPEPIRSLWPIIQPCAGGVIQPKDYDTGVRAIYYNSCFPQNANNSSALTMGRYVFVSLQQVLQVSATGSMPRWMKSHEYIHTLQYQADSAQYLSYLVDVLFNNAQGQYRQVEAIAYVWGSWTRAYGHWEKEPWEIWKPL